MKRENTDKAKLQSSEVGESECETNADVRLIGLMHLLTRPHAVKQNGDNKISQTSQYATNYTNGYEIDSKSEDNVCLRRQRMTKQSCVSSAKPASLYIR